MGGDSIGKIERYDDYIHFEGQPELVKGGFAGFNARIESKLTGSKGTLQSRLFNHFRTSGLWPNTKQCLANTDRVFKVGVARDHELPFNDGVWFYNLPLEKEYKSFEVNFDEFYFAWHGKPQDDVPPPYGSILRKIRININDNNPEPFEADINIIQGI